MKKLLILNGGDGDIPIINAAHKLGYYVIATGRDTSLPGYAYADEVHPGDYSNKERMCQLARELQVDAVISNANDAGIKTASYIAEQLGFPGFDSYKTTCELHDKDTMKDIMLEIGLPCPVSVPFSSVSEADDWARTASEYPYICKPVDLSAGRGMKVVRRFEEFHDAIKYAFDTSRSGRFVIEPFIEGVAQSHSCFIVNKKVVAWHMTNEYTSIYNPYCVDACCCPADQAEVLAPMLNEYIERLAERLNLVNGVVHTQHIVRDGIPYILEITRRHPGAFYSVPAALTMGIDYSEWYVRFMLGDDGKDFPEFHVQPGSYGRLMLMADRNGIVTDVEIDEELHRYVFDEKHFWEPKPVTVGSYTTDIIGILFLKYPSREVFDNLRPRMNDLYHVVYAGE